MSTTDSLTSTPPPAAQPAPAGQPAPAPATATANGLSITSLVLSILAIPTGMFLLGLAGIVLGFVGWNREPAGRTLATWGIVIGFVATLGGWALAAIGFAVAAPFALWGFGFGGF